MLVVVILFEKNKWPIAVSVWRDLLVLGRIRSSSRVLDLFGRGCINGNNTNKTVQEASQKTEATKTLLQCRVPGKKED